MPAGSGRYPSGQRGQTVNLLAYAFGGSNPPLPTIVATGAGTDRTAGGLFEVRVAPTRPDNGPAVVSGDSASCGNSSAVERQPSKLGVAGSNPVSRSIVATGLRAARPEGGLAEAGVAPTGAADRRRFVGRESARAEGRAARAEGGLAEAGVAPTGAADRRRFVGRESARAEGRAARAEGGLAEAGVAPTGAADRRRRDPHGRARTVQSPGSAHVAQLAEHALGKGEVSGSIPDMGSRLFSPTKRGAHGR
jgi:hypothetical protein